MSDKLDVFLSRRLPRLFGTSLLFAEQIEMSLIDVPEIHALARERLKAQLADTSRGHVQILSGPVGVGKTHLLRWLKEYSADLQRPVWFSYQQGCSSIVENLPTGRVEKLPIWVFDSVGVSRSDSEQILSFAEHTVRLLEKSNRGLVVWSVLDDFYHKIRQDLPQNMRQALEINQPIDLKEGLTGKQAFSLIEARLHYLWSKSGLDWEYESSKSPSEVIYPFSEDDVSDLHGHKVTSILKACEEARKEARKEKMPPRINSYWLGALYPVDEDDQEPETKTDPNIEPLDSTDECADPTENTELDDIVTDLSTILPLKHVHLRNYRSIRDAKIELHPRITVFFAKNAGGKTTVLEAVATLLASMVVRLTDVRAPKERKLSDGDIRLPVKLRPDVAEYKDVRCEFVKVSLHCQSGLSWYLQRHAIRRSNADREERKGLRILHAAVDISRKELGENHPLPLVLFYGSERAVPHIPQRMQATGRTKDSRLLAYKAALIEADFRELFYWMIRKGELESLTKERLGSSYRLPELQWVRRAIEVAIPRCTNPRIKFDPVRMVVDYRHDDGEIQETPLTSLSNGYRTHFCMVIDIAFRMVQLNPTDDLEDPVRGTRSSAVILIDEIDLHLHPVWQETVVAGLLKAFPRAQFLISTHSEQVIGTLDRSCVRKLEWDDGEVGVGLVQYAEGASGERILMDLMGASDRVETQDDSGEWGTGVTRKLREYARMVQSGEGLSTEAKALREFLDDKLPGDERVRRVDFEIQRQQRIARMKERKS